MSAFPSHVFSRDYVKVRFLEESVPLAINRRHYGMPRGVYLGFIPAASPGSSVLALNPDPNHGFSLLKVGSAGARVNVDLFTADVIQLDFTNHTVFPVYVLATANYTQGVVTNARVFTRSTPASGPNEITICQVSKPAADLVADTTVPTLRQPPLAFTGQRYGFMGDGAVEAIDASATTNAEVIAARLSPYTGAHASLGARIDDDLSAAAMADRLGLLMANVLSNTYTGVSGLSWNVSSSFSSVSRLVAPFIDFGPLGSETVEGAVCAPNDSVRNFCFVTNATTGGRLIDTTTPTAVIPTHDPVFGRLDYTAGNIGALKTVTFTTASSNVTGGGTGPFSAPLAEGDLLEGPDGKYYAVQTIIDPDTAMLSSAFQGTSGAIVDPGYQRFTLSFFTAAGAYAVPAGTSVKFTFPAFTQADRGVYDGLQALKIDAEIPDPPAATSTLAGKVREAATGSQAGTIRNAQSGGVPVGGGNFHTLDFTSALTTATPLGPGQIGIVVPGAVGPPGAPANDGPPGATGTAGAGFSIASPFRKSTLISGPAAASYTEDFSLPPGPNAIGTIRMLTGGLAYMDWFANDTWDTTAFFAAGSMGTISYSLLLPSDIKLWLGAYE